MAFHSRNYVNSPTFIGSTPVVSEPMTLGSPTTSPQAPGTQYLPGFLLGDSPQTNVPPPTTSMFSNSRPMQLSPNQISPSALNAAKTVQPSVGFLNQPDRLGKRHTSPPTQSLWSTAQKPVSRFSQQVPAVPDGHIGSSIRHSTPSGLTVASRSFVLPTSPTCASPGLWNQPSRPLTGVCSPLGTNNQNNILTSDQLVDVLQSPGNVDRERGTEDCWVTVFGFPPARASFILNQFGQFGTIEKHVVTNDGNWMHIKYQNKLQARCALNRNGRVFGDNIMVGVTPCNDQDVMCDRATGVTQASDFDADRENSLSTVWNSPIVPPRPKRQTGFLGERSEVRHGEAGLREKRWLNQSFTGPADSGKPIGGCGVARHSSMRALAGDGRVTGHLNRTTSVRQNKESGLLSKALGYMFGWS